MHPLLPPRRLALAAAAALLPLMAVSGTAETVADDTARLGLDLSITQSDQALVHDRRQVMLGKGDESVVFPGIAREAVDDSADLTGDGVTVSRQSFSLAGLDADRLLALSVGREVSVIWPGSSGAAGTEQRVTVLSAGPQPVFLADGKMISGTPARIIHDDLPPGLTSKPAFRADINSTAPGKRVLDLAYLVRGVSWQADYVLDLPADSDQATLSAWATLTNRSGTDFPQARIRLLAGDINRAGGIRAMRADAPPMLKEARMEPGLSPETLETYHLYTLEQPVSLRDGERQQSALLAPVAVTAERKLVLDPLPSPAWKARSTETPVQNPWAVLTLKNAATQPLPAGTVRVFQRTKDGGGVFLGEDRLSATPKGESVHINLGRAFDVLAKRSQSDFTRVAADVTEAAWDVRLSNAGDRPVKVQVRESFGGEWLVVDESQRHAKDNATTASWTMSVPARGESTLKYRVRVRE